MCLLLYNQSQCQQKTWKMYTVSLNTEPGKINKGNSDLFKPTMLLRLPGEDGQYANIFTGRLWELTGQGGEN